MPRKTSIPPPPPPAPVAPPVAAPPAVKTAKPRKARILTAKDLMLVALWVGDNPKPKHWFDSLTSAQEFLASGKLSRKDDEKIHLAVLQPVKLSFTVTVGDAKIIPVVQNG